MLVLQVQICERHVVTLRFKLDKKQGKVRKN